MNNDIRKTAGIVLLFLMLGSPLSLLAQTEDVSANVDASVDTMTSAPQKKAFNYQVTGVVRHAVTKKVMQGVAVTSGDKSVLTDEKGTFRILVPKGQTAKLVLTAEDCLSRTVYRSASQLNVPMDVTMYEKGFASVKDQDNAYSITPSLTVDDELSTRFAGDVRTVGRSATTAIGANMFIRGYNSLNANVQPLVIVDGTIWDTPFNRESIHHGFVTNTLADIDVTDIESVEVIKDATSIYGSKGANGVLVIKTIRGREKATKISFDASMGMNFKPKVPSTMNASQFRTYVSELIKGTQTATTTAEEFEGYLDEDLTSITYHKYHNTNDWNDDVYRTGATQHYGLKVQGGDDIARYAISLGYTGALGNVRGTDFSRLNARINSDLNLYTGFKVGTEIFFTQVDRELRDDGVNTRTSPTFLAQIKSPFLIAHSYTTDGTGLTTSLEDVDVFGVSNPVSVIENAQGGHKQYRFGISAIPQLQLSKTLELSTRFSYYVDNLKEHYFSPMLGVSPIVLEGQGISYNTVKDQTASQSSLFSDTKLSFDQTFGGMHHLTALAGCRVFINTYENSIGIGHNTGDDQIFNLSSSLAFRSTDGGVTNWNSSSVYAQANYSFDQRYDLWAAIACDASSRFGSMTEEGFRLFGGTWATFPSIGAKWNVKAESFLNAVSAIDQLQVRVAAGMTGNDDLESISRYAYLAPVNYLGSAVGKEISNLSNNTLQWETTQKQNAGFDLTVLDGRLTLSFDVYQHTTDHLLTTKTSEKVSGLETYICNSGKLENKGFELGLGIKTYNGPKLKWNTSFTVAHYKNQILELPEGDYLTEIYGGQVLTAVGQPAGMFYGYQTDGIFQTTESAEAAGLVKQNDNASYSSFAAGDVHFLDTGDGKVTSTGQIVLDKNDQTVIGNPNPDFTGSFSNTLTRGNLSLDVLCTYSYGNEVYNYQRQMLESMSELYNQSAAVLNRWRYEGQATNMPKATYGDPMGNSRFSDRWIEDGSYFKIKNIRLTYLIPINSSYIDGVTVWGACSNVYTFTNYLGSDPETSVNSSVLYQGIDNGLLTHGRSFTIGVKLNL
jgi:TonB-linked SusC/RagA family outer membrane protein